MHHVDLDACASISWQRSTKCWESSELRRRRSGRKTTPPFGASLVFFLLIYNTRNCPLSLGNLTIRPCSNFALFLYRAFTGAPTLSSVGSSRGEGGAAGAPGGAW